MPRAPRHSIRVGCDDHLPFRQRSLACRRKYKSEAESRRRQRVGSAVLNARARDLRFGLAEGQFDEMLRSQGGVCAICGNPETAATKSVLSVDHNHDTGAVRGLLCNRCNRAIGLLRDDPNVLEAAAQYLRERNT